MSDCTRRVAQARAGRALVKFHLFPYPRLIAAATMYHHSLLTWQHSTALLLPPETRKRLDPSPSSAEGAYRAVEAQASSVKGIFDRLHRQ